MNDQGGVGKFIVGLGNYFNSIQTTLRAHVIEYQLVTVPQNLSPKPNLKP